MENLNSRISGVCINVLIGTAACCLEKDVHSSEKSVQTSLFSSVGFGWIPCPAGSEGRSSREELLGTGEVVPGRAQGSPRSSGTGPAWEGTSVEGAKKKIGFYVFGQGSYFEYIWLNRIFHFTVLIINHTHWINAIFVIPLKCNFFCTVSELHDRCNILFLCSWLSFSM